MLPEGPYYPPTGRPTGRMQATGAPPWGGPQPPETRRRPLRGFLAGLVLLLLAATAVFTVLVLNPDFGLLVPGGAGESLHALATAARARLESLISDEGALGGLRRAVEPYLSRVGLNLQTVLLGLFLIAVAAVCIRVLALTSRPDEADEAPEAFPGGGPARGGRRGRPGDRGAGAGSPYWPYDGRPGPGAGGPSAIYGPPGQMPPEMPPGMPPGPPGAIPAGPAGGIEGPLFSEAATGDAWPIVRKSFPRTAQPATQPEMVSDIAGVGGGIAPGTSASGAAAAGAVGAGGTEAGEAPAGAAPAGASPTVPPAATSVSIARQPSAGLTAAAPSGSGSSVPGGTVGAALGREGSADTAPTAPVGGGGGLDFMPTIVPAFGAGPPSPRPGGPAPSRPGVPLSVAGPAPGSSTAAGAADDAAVAAEVAGAVDEEYLADMPAPPYSTPHLPPSHPSGASGRAVPGAQDWAAAAAQSWPAAAAQGWPAAAAQGRPAAEEQGWPAAQALPQAGPQRGLRPGEAWVESRPGIGVGLKKFILPGFLLVLLGAGGAYSLEFTPLATFIAGGPYGPYLLGTAAVVVSMAVAMWFMNGPMRATARRLSGAGAAVGGTFGGEAAAALEPGVVGGRFSSAGVAGPAPGLRPVGGPIPQAGRGPAGPVPSAGWSPAGPAGAGARPSARPGVRLVAPAPIPGRAALESGLDAPDAVDWSKLPKPSIFIPGTQAGTTVGLDIGTAWIKVAQVGVGRRGLELVNLGLIPTPEGVLGEGDINDPDALGDVIKDLLAGRNIVQRQVTAALGGQGVIIRHVQFPVMSPDELREVLRWEAEHHIPIPPAEAVVDFTIMPGQADADERGNRQMRVMLVGAQKRVVEAQVQAMRRAKLIPRGVDAEALACYRVVEAAGHFVEDPLRYAQAVIDLGHSSTKLGIYLRGALEMSRTLGVGGRTFTAVLAERLKVPEVEAETLKRQYGVHPEGGRVLQALMPTFQDLMFEVRRSFEFFASRHFGQSVRHVYLIGGGARMPGIAGAMARYLNPSLGERVPEGAEVRVEVVDPLTAVGLTPRLEKHAGLIGPEFVTALGLALTEEEGEGAAQ